MPTAPEQTKLKEGQGGSISDLVVQCRWPMLGYFGAQ
jgi:hypothetical protein